MPTLQNSTLDIKLKKSLGNEYKSIMKH